MKISFTIVLCIAVVAATFAQSINKQVVASAGQTLTNGTTMVTSTIGEPIVGLKTTTVSINQGFLATAVTNTTLSIEELAVDKTVKLFPNPVTDILNITIEKNTKPVAVNIYSATGKQVATYTLNTVDQSFNLNHLAKGMYVVQLRFTDNNIVKTFKILKK